MKFIQTLTLLLFVACCGRAGTFTTLFDFSADPIGETPVSQLVQGPNGTLYGETFNGEGNSWGTVFAINPDGTGFTNLFTFSYTNGAFPEGGLILSGNTLYGTTFEGANGYGTVFAVSTNGLNFTNLFNFTNGIDGESPETSLLLSGNTLYGTAEGGGLHGYGAIFAINTDSTGFTNLYQFTSANGGNPGSSLILSGSTLYGTGGGGAFGDGSVFAVNTNGSGFTNLVSFDNYNGYAPVSSLILSGNTLYGTTEQGGAHGDGEVFAVHTDSTGFTNLYSFGKTTGDGDGPEAGLVLSGSTLYGTTYGGGTKNFGNVFAINTDSLGFTNLYSFTDGADGADIVTGLILSGHTLYGTANRGGTNNDGTIFSLTFTPPASPPSQPALSIHVTGGNLVITWPDTATGYALASATNLGSSASWSIVTNIPVIVNGFYTVTVSTTGGQKYYSLARPALSIHVIGGNLVITWPDTVSGFTLMSSATLGSSASWSTVTNTPVIVNGFYTVTVTMTGGQMFYSLSP